VLATLLFTDIVSVDAVRRADGRRAWRSLLDEHHALVRAGARRSPWPRVKTIGDGFLARFDSPASAIGGTRIRDGVKTLHLECRRRSTPASASSGNIWQASLSRRRSHHRARGPNEILVSQMVRDLAPVQGSISRRA